MTNPNVQGHCVYVTFSAPIDPITTQGLIATLTQVVNQGASEIYLAMSTPGGSVMNGMNIYNVLRSLPVKVTTHNVGNVDSIGNAIFLAGEERYANPHSTFMFHGVGIDVERMRLEEKVLGEMLDGIVADQKRIGSVITERTNLNEGQVAELFREARTKDAQHALSVGIVGEIKDFKIPTGAPVLSLVFQR